MSSDLKSWRLDPALIYTNHAWLASSSGGIMTRRGKLIDGAGSGATIINNYAVFIGYLSMGIKGLGFLILTWTTVVLLGGFVSELQNNDFWCLTFITLVQTAGIFDVYLNEKLTYILHSARGLLVGSISSILSYEHMERAENTGYGFLVYLVRLLLAIVCVVVQMLVLAILLCPLAAVYVSGLLISTGISLWRLIQHDHGDNSDEKSNLKPAIASLYCLALLQGVLFLYRIIFARVGQRIAKNLIPTCGDDELEVVLSYLRETKSGCEKNPSFARRRNFITHAVDLIGSKSPGDRLSGVQLLYTVICIGERRLKQGMELISPDYRQSAGDCLSSVKRLYTGVCFMLPSGQKKARAKGRKIIKEIIGERMLMKDLIMSASSSPVPQKVLLQALNLRDTYDREMRNQAARIVAYLALDINLEQFPQGIQYISTLIGTFKEYCEPYQRKRLIHKYDQVWDPQASRLTALPVRSDKLWKAYEKLVLRGLCILQKLATDENNSRIMSETQGLLPRIMAPLTSDLIHQFSGGAWSIMVVEGSLKVMRMLVAAPGDTGARIHQEISNNKEAVHTMERILSCDYCHVKLQKQAMLILIQLYMETKNRPAFIKMLVDIFVSSGSRDRSIRKLAGEALVKLCLQSGSNAGIILHADGDVVGSLTNILVDVKDKTCRIRAAEILEHMCNIHHTQDDECLSKLKEAMTTTMPKVLAEILGYELTKDETQATTEADQIEVVVKQDGIENQSDDPQEHAQDKTSSSSTHPEYKEDEEDVDVEEDEFENDADEEFRAPLLSLCVMICDTFVDADQDLASRFGAISLPKKLEEMVKRNSVAMVVCLSLMKVTCKMVISMMIHRGSYVKEDLDSLMGALSSASKRMCHLDVSTVFAGEDLGAHTMKPARSLVSLVKEAEESVETRMATNAHDPENIMEPSTSGLPPMGDTD